MLKRERRRLLIPIQDCGGLQRLPEQSTVQRRLGALRCDPAGSAKRQPIQAQERPTAPASARAPPSRADQTHRQEGYAPTACSDDAAPAPTPAPRHPVSRRRCPATLQLPSPWPASTAAAIKRWPSLSSAQHPPIWGGRSWACVCASLAPR